MLAKLYLIAAILLLVDLSFSPWDKTSSKHEHKVATLGSDSVANSVRPPYPT